MKKKSATSIAQKLHLWQMISVGKQLFSISTSCFQYLTFFELWLFDFCFTKVLLTQTRSY